jgi:hypothetical protein
MPTNDPTRRTSTFRLPGLAPATTYRASKHLYEDGWTYRPTEWAPTTEASGITFTMDQRVSTPTPAEHHRLLFDLLFTSGWGEGQIPPPILARLCYSPRRCIGLRLDCRVYAPDGHLVRQGPMLLLAMNVQDPLLLASLRYAVGYQIMLLETEGPRGKIFAILIFAPECGVRELIEQTRTPPGWTPGSPLPPGLASELWVRDPFDRRRSLCLGRPLTVISPGPWTTPQPTLDGLALLEQWVAQSLGPRLT